jgi:glucan phosphoethanolaminetransferase (alkaline phosphatase superfamily)
MKRVFDLIKITFVFTAGIFFTLLYFKIVVSNNGTINTLARFCGTSPDRASSFLELFNWTTYLLFLIIPVLILQLIVLVVFKIKHKL